MIRTINGWRAVFALMIVLFHVGVAGLEEMTWAGVSFFLMASGFLLAMKHRFQQLDGPSYRQFAWRHAAKLYPLHWLALAMWIVGLALIGILAVEPVSLVLNATLLQSWSLTHSIYFSYNKFSWFLSTLLFCYLCYPLLARWFMPLRLRYKAIILAVAALVVIAVLAGSDDYDRTALYVFPPVRIIDFIIGMALVSLLPKIKSRKTFGKQSNGTDAELLAIALLSATVLVYRSSSENLLPWSDAILWWLPVALILVVSLLYDRRACDGAPRGPGGLRDCRHRPVRCRCSRSHCVADPSHRHPACMGCQPPLHPPHRPPAETQVTTHQTRLFSQVQPFYAIGCIVFLDLMHIILK